MTQPTKAEIEAARDEMPKPYYYVDGRGPFYNGIGQWISRHGETIRALLDAAGR
jgi:hypothetical protein